MAELITRAQVADMMGVKRRSVEYWIRKGLPIADRTSTGVRLFDRGAAIRWVSSNINRQRAREVKDILPPIRDISAWTYSLSKICADGKCGFDGCTCKELDGITITDGNSGIMAGQSHALCQCRYEKSE